MRATSIHTHLKTAKTFAFSLIEVVLSLGVIAFALVAILGVFPVGLAANRSSISDTRAAQIINAVEATIDAQCDTFTNVQCYGETLDLSTLSNTTTTRTLYVTYPSPAVPEINNDSTSEWIYRIDMTFDNDPDVTGSATTLGAGKLNKIHLRLSGRSATEAPVQAFFVARNRG